jgi:hypothetical protein
MDRLLGMVLIVLLVAVASIAYLLKPEDAGLKYWLSIGWCEVLVTMNWFASAVVISGSKRQTSEGAGPLMGALPGINIVVFFYSIVSFTSLLLYYTGKISWPLHMTGQVAVTAIAAVVVLFSIVAAKGASEGAQPVVSKSDILSECRRLKRLKISEEADEAISDVMGFVTSKMPHPAKLDQDNLVSLISQLRSIGPSNIDCIQEIRKLIKEL